MLRRLLLLWSLLLLLGLYTPITAQEAPSGPVDIRFMTVEANPILVPGEKGAWDTVSVRFPNVVFHDGTYHMFYGTFQNFNSPVSIGYAQSADGIHWAKSDKNPILKGDGTGFDAFGVTRPIATVIDDGTWVIYYSGIPKTGAVFGTDIGRATAPSPTGPWTREDEPVLQVGGQGEWDARFIFPDSVVLIENKFRLYYSSGFMVGMATSNDGIRWIKYNDPQTQSAYSQSDPVLPKSPSTTWDSAIAWGSSIQRTKAGWEMFYYGTNNAQGGPTVDIGYAFSQDGIRWAKYEHNPVVNLANRQAFFPSFVLKDDGAYLLYYAVTTGSTYTEFHLATGTITWKK